MKKFRDIVEGKTNLMESVVPPTKDAVEEKVIEVWKKIMPNSAIWASKSSIGSDNYSIITATIGKDKSEWNNGIWQNDPLSLMVAIETFSDKIIIEWSNNSLSIKPENKYMAFGRKKLPLRKMTVSNMKDFEKKMTESFNKVKSSIQESLSNGDFDVYDQKVRDIIKSKV